MAVVLDVENLCKHYGKFDLKNVSFQLEHGSIMGFIGRNGAGKTTTMKCLLNFVHPDFGEVKFFNLNWKENEKAIKERIGFAFGGVNYYPTKTLKSITNTTKMFYSSWDEEVYQSYMQKFNLDENKKIKELSDGMKVKFNLVLALSHHAELLILDEPTSGLDPVSRDELLCILKELAQKSISIVFSTHITSDLDKCADHITYIKDGKIVKSCTKTQFIDSFGGGNLEDIMLKIEKGEA